MEYLFIYLLQLADNIEIIKVLLFIPLLIVFVFFCIISVSSRFQYSKYVQKNYIDLTEDTVKGGIKFCKIVLPILIILQLFLCLIPTKQTLLLLGGTYLGKKAINAVVTDKKIEKINTIIELELDKRIKELKENDKT